MKKIVCLIIFLIYQTIKAQMPVTDAAANAQLRELAISLETTNAQLEKMSGISTSTEGHASASKILDEKNLKFIGEIEDTYWKVSDYLKKGEEMRNILGMEEKILKQISELRKEVSSSGLSRSSIQDFYHLTHNILKNTGTLVDTSIDIVSDDKLRMTHEERRKQLQEILGGLRLTSNTLNDKIISVRQYRRLNEQSKKQKQMMEQQRKRMENIKSKK